MMIIRMLLLLSLVLGCAGHSLNWYANPAGSLRDVDMEGHRNLTVRLDRFGWNSTFQFSVYEVSGFGSKYYKLHDTREAALDAANRSGCVGVHEMGDKWMAGEKMGSCRDITDWLDCDFNADRALLVQPPAPNGTVFRFDREPGTYYLIDGNRELCRAGAKVRVTFVPYSASPSLSPVSRSPSPSSSPSPSPEASPKPVVVPAPTAAVPVNTGTGTSTESGSTGASTWEYSAIFAMSRGETYSWVVSKRDGSFAASTNRVMLMSVGDSTSEALESAETQAKSAWENGKAQTVQASGSTAIGEGRPFQMVFDSSKSFNIFSITPSSTTSRRDGATFALLSEVNPSRLSSVSGAPFLYRSNGEALTPLLTKDSTVRKASVGEAIGAAFTTTLATFIGVILLVPGFKTLASKYGVMQGLNAFASGALLALIVFIMIPEALLGISFEYPNVSQQAAWFGSFVLGGFFLPVAIDLIISAISGKSNKHKLMVYRSPSGSTDGSDVDAEDKVSSGGSDDHVQAMPETNGEGVFYPLEVPSNTPVPATSPQQYSTVNPEAEPVNEPILTKSAASDQSFKSMVRNFFKCCPLNGVVWSIIMGDGFHNFVEGVLIGAAFKFCGSSKGWSVVGAVVAHEVASEVSEFWLLINPAAGGLSWLQAMVLNFLKSLTVVIGCLIVSYVDVTAFTLGILLSLGAGLLLYTAIIPTWSFLLQEIKPRLSSILVVTACFTFGAIAIGLVLLGHDHCDITGM